MQSITRTARSRGWSLPSVRLSPPRRAQLGKSRRATEETAANASSSRSHAVLLVELPAVLADGAGGRAGGRGPAAQTGKLVLVDCAGALVARPPPAAPRSPLPLSAAATLPPRPR